MTSSHPDPTGLYSPIVHSREYHCGVLIRGGAATLAKVKDIIRDDRLGLDYGDRLIKQLQVGNGHGARYIASQLEGKSESERKEYLKDLKRKKILTLQVNRQLSVELRKRRFARRKDR